MSHLILKSEDTGYNAQIMKICVSPSRTSTTFTITHIYLARTRVKFTGRQVVGEGEE